MKIQSMGNLFRLFVVLMLLLFPAAGGAVRIKYSINELWRFSRQDAPQASSSGFSDASWEMVHLPHTWNCSDTMDDEQGYYRGAAWYRRSIHIPHNYHNKQITILFEGANQEVELFVNGNSAGTHAGGYTRFSFDITALLKPGADNQLAVKVNNRHNPDIPPLSADFTFFGGIYRDVYLVVSSQQHISTTHYASDGVYVRTPEVSESLAKLSIETMLSNASSVKKQVIVEHLLMDADQIVVGTVSKKYKLGEKTVNIPVSQYLELKQPSLWSPESPYLYSVCTRVYDEKKKQVLDEVYQTIGFRWYEFTTEKGFVMNGKPYKLIGTNRHQCYDRIGNALPDEIHVKDVLLLKQMGGNFLRVSHYPQDPVVMEMCDKLGIITSVEIPIVNEITMSEGFTSTSLEMTREMIFQDFNRPSVVIWAYMNEVLLYPPFKNNPQKHDDYLKAVGLLAQQIENQIRKDDPSRYTMIPFHANIDLYDQTGLTHIPKILGWNLYQGWYGSTFDRFGSFLDSASERLKGIPFIITEYGADVDPRLHSFNPLRMDYTQEWANLYHEEYIRAIMARTFVVGATIWNLNDFHSEERGNAVPHINSKGIVTTTRQLKDTYLHYQALLLQSPVVNIGGRNWTIRGGNADSNSTCMQPVKVYSNLPEVEFFINGTSLGRKTTVEAIAEFTIPFINGMNVLEAVGHTNGREIRDLIKVDFKMIPVPLKCKKQDFTSINVMLGSKRYFEDKEMDVIWLPEQEYTHGNWGYTGGSAYVKPTRFGQQPASDVNVAGTDRDPVFQTMRRGIESFRLDVPDGEYTVSLYFAEIISVSPKVLVYNLGDDPLAEEKNERVFDVYINEQQVIHELNIAKEAGDHRAIIRKFIVQAKDGTGINIRFDALKGEAVLNALRVYHNN
ncbi:MAG: glycoside hydrolase family 2 TIM barrel-domain containing protein [Paludibacter sp.]|nr:glycoside hydrolase family 2 TIM barrel-domain containing protein [Paludibacter sp.]